MVQAVNQPVETTEQQPTVLVPSRFNGPPGMGNGGFTAGMLSRFYDGPVEVTLRRPVPMDRPLAADEKADHVALWHDYALIATVRPAAVEIDVPWPVSFTDAERASRDSRLHTEHVFPDCFVCGVARSDGLDIIPGEVEGRAGVLATPFVPRAEFAEDGVVAPEFVFGALDCPGGIVIGYDEPRPIVLGRITAEILEAVRPGRRYVALGWRAGEDGRKQLAGTAIFSERGDLVARAKAVWFDIRS